MKKSILFVATLIAISSHAQQSGRVGINTENPKATLHIAASPDDATALDGVIPPKIAGDQLKAKNYTADQEGAIVYVTSIPTNLDGQVINVRKAGYYFFDGTIWKSFEDDTLEDVVKRGNYSPKFITFIDQDKGKLGINPTLHNYYFGDQNSNATGNFNISFGFDSLLSLTTGVGNSALGAYALRANTVGKLNTAVGGRTLQTNTTGNSNTAVGVNSLQTNTTGNTNTAVGANSLKTNTTGSWNTAVGVHALSENSQYDKNVAVGAMTFLKSKSIGNSVAVGYQTGYALNGLYNTNIGYSAGNHNGSGKWNVYLGAMAGGSKINATGDGGSSGTGTGNANVYIGASAGSGVNGDNNVFIGSESGFAPGIHNTITVNNRLVINGSYTKKNDDEFEPGSVNNGNTIENGLIVGDFKDRWVKFNGNLKVNPRYNTSDSNYTKTLVAKPDGTVGLADAPMIPTPPATGSYTLISVNGLMQWVAN